MKKYITEVEAQQFTGSKESIPPGIGSDVINKRYFIVTREDGPILLDDGDWIVKDCLGCFHVVNNKDFQAAYKPLETHPQEGEQLPKI